jgi:hypothetical protein
MLPLATKASSESKPPVSATKPADPPRPSAPARSDKLILRAHALDLHGLDTLPARDLLVFVRPDERPLQGLGGLLDWRLCGGLTRILERELFEGRAGESLLTTTRRKLPAERIFLYGTGREDPRDLLPEALAMVGRAGGREVAIAPFGKDEAASVEVAERAARAAYDAGIGTLTFLAEKVGAATKALVVVEAQHPWAVLETSL